MRSRLRSWWWQIERHPVTSILIVLFFMLGVLALVGGYKFNWDWTGFNGVKVTYKTLYDWLQLLVIPVVLAIAGYVINLTISKGEQEATKQRDKTEHKIAEDNQHEAALQGYIDKMSELLLEKRLRESTDVDEVRKIARVRTLTVLTRLDPIRKRSVLQFLYESDLIDMNKRIICLNGADLSNANLTAVDLHEADLRRVNLKGAILDWANLNLANLRKTNLSGAEVTTEQLNKAQTLQGATMPDGSIHP